MKRAQYVFRPDLTNPQHRKAWEILQSVTPTQRKEYLVQVILAAEQADRLEKIVRTALREELQDADLTSQISDTPQEKDIPTNALDFLSAL